METTFPDPQSEPDQGRSASTTVLLLVVAALVIAGTLWYFLTPSPSQKVPVARLHGNAQMSPAELEYLKKVEIGNIAMSRAENFLHQEVTIINGEVHNAGSEAVSALRLTVEFNDDLNQIILRETRAALGTPETPLAAGERRAFEISVEHVPASWNMQQPAIRPTYLQLPSHK